MAITTEDLKGIEGLELNENHANALIELVGNKENDVIANKVKEIHTKYDNDIKEITGLEKQANQKTYDFLKQTLGDYKSKNDGFTETKTSLEAKIKELEDKGVDVNNVKIKELSEQLKQVNEQKDLLVQDSDKFKTQLQAKEDEYNASLNNFKIDNMLTSQVAGLKFKKGISEDLQKTVTNAILSELKSSYKIEIDDKGMATFKDTNGNPVRDPNNNHNHITTKSLLTSKFGDMLDSGKPGIDVGGNGGNFGNIDISGVKNQVQADSLIRQHVEDNLKIDPLTQAGAKKMMEIRKQLNVASLPMQ